MHQVPGSAATDYRYRTGQQGLARSWLSWHDCLICGLLHTLTNSAYAGRLTHQILDVLALALSLMHDLEGLLTALFVHLGPPNLLQQAQAVSVAHLCNEFDLQGTGLLCRLLQGRHLHEDGHGHCLTWSCAVGRCSMWTAAV